MKGMWGWMRTHMGWLLTLMASIVLAFTAGWHTAPTCFFTEHRVVDFSRFLVCYNARPATTELYAQTMELCTAWGWQKVVTKPMTAVMAQPIVRR